MQQVAQEAERVVAHTDVYRPLSQYELKKEELLTECDVCNSVYLRTLKT